MNSEQAIISILLNEPDLLPLANIQAGNFQSQKHGDVFAAMKDLGEYDLVTVSQKTGLGTYLSQLYSDFAMGSLNEKTLNYHCTQVKDTYNRSQLHGMARNILSSDKPISTVIAETEGIISALESGAIIENNADTLKRVFKKMEKRVRSTDGIVGTRLGFEKVDMLLGGLNDGRFVIVAGRPKQGKSALVGNVIEHIAIDNKEPCVVYTFEMSKDVWMERMVFSVAKVAPVQGGKNRWTFKQEEYSRMFKTAEVLQNAPIHIVEAAGMHLDDLCLSMQTYHNKLGIKNFFIDYLQLVRYSSKEYETVTEVSKRMVEMKQKLKCNVFGVAQLSRASVDGGKVRKPCMSDLRSSGQLEQDADAILFVHRPKAYNDEGDDVLILDANRHGDVGDIRANFNGFNFQWREI